MKRLIFALILLMPFYSKAQAHLGASLAELKALHTDNIFKTAYTTNGTKYASSEMYYGTFAYYFDNETGLTDYCIQIPKNMVALNAQVEVYNKKYTIISETSWKAYLEGGGIMKIELTYDEEDKLYMFSYTN